MKLLFLIHSLQCGGSERVAVNLANHWCEKGWDVTVVTFFLEDVDHYQLHPNIKRISLNLFQDGNFLYKFKRNLKRIIRVRQLLKKIKPDIAIGFLIPANMLLAIANYKLNYTKVIGSEHRYPPFEDHSNFSIWWKSKIYLMLHAVTVLTQEYQNWIMSRTNISNVAIIPNSIPASMVDQPIFNRFEQCAKGNRLKLLAVGRLHYQKGFNLLIPIFAKLSSQFLEWDLLIAGEGPERKNLERLIKKYNLEKRVRLLGAVSDVNSLYAGADCFVFSSEYEGFGNVLVEAMACGLPAISFDCDTGPRNIIRHNVDGLLVPAGDTEALYNGLSLLLKDKDLRKRLGKRAVEARERFSPERIAAKWESLFEKLLNENSLSTTCQDQVT